MKNLRNYLAIIILTFSVAACNGGGGSGSGSGGGSGGGSGSGGSGGDNTLSFDINSVNIHLDDTNDLVLKFTASKPNQTIKANISSSDPNVAVLTPKCTLSNQEGATNDCKVILKGNALGTAIITASASGTNSASATANVSTNIEPGYLEFNPNPINIPYKNTSTITLSLAHSSGVKNQGVTITEAAGFSSIAKNVSGITTCTLSSPPLSNQTQNTCPPIQVFGMTPGKTWLTAKAVYGLADKIPQATENITVLTPNIPPKRPSMKFSNGSININDTKTATLFLNGYNITSNTPVNLSITSTNGHPTNNIKFEPKCAFNKDNDLCKITVSGFVGSEGADYTITASAFGLKKAITYINISPVGSEGSIGFSNSSENVVWGGFTPAKIQANVTNYEGDYFSLILQANNNDVILSPPPNSYNVSCSKPSLETNPSCVCSGPFNGASTSCTVYASAAVPGGKNTNTQITAIAPDGYLKPNPQEPQSTTVNIVPGQINGGMFFSASAMNVYDKPQTISLFLLHSQKQSKFKVSFKSSNSNISVAPVGGDCELSSNNYVCQLQITANSISGPGAIIEASAPSGLGVEPTSLAVNVNQNGYLTADPTYALMASVTGSQGVNVILRLHNYKNMPTIGIPYQVTSDNTSIATVGTPGGPITFSPSNTSSTIIINPEGLAGDTQIKLIPAPQYAAGGYPSLSVPAISMPPVQQPRNIHFVNKCSYPVWFGLDGGATAKYMSSGDCPANSTYSSSAGTCYWNAPPPPAAGYELPAINGTANITIPLSGIETQWSGTMAARTGCSGGTCDFAASCPTSGTGNLACTAGFQPPVSLVEVTFATTGLDYYDISLISGITVPTSIKPTNNKGYGNDATNPYYCGTAGSMTPQSLGNTTIGAATWEPQIPATIQTLRNNNPVNIPGAVFNLVSGTTAISSAHPNPACSTQHTCTHGLICGYTLDAVSNGINTNPTYLLSCGKRIAYVTGDGIYKLNTTANNHAPFDFGGKDMTPGQNGNVTNSLGFTNADFFECPYPTLNSAYQPLTPPSGLETCGYVDWSQLGITQADTANFITPASPPNQAWVDQVLSGIKWLKTACPSCYSYPYDDPSSTFTCHNNASINNTANLTDYTVTFCPNN